MKRMIKANEEYEFTYTVEPIPESQDEYGIDRCWAIKFPSEDGEDHYVWITQYGDKEFIVEDSDGENLAKGLVYKTFSGAKVKALNIAKRQVMRDFFTD